MNTSADIIAAYPNDVVRVTVDKGAEHHGEVATEVRAELVNGKTVTGTFSTEARPGFGGVEFSSKKDISGLMIAKIKSVLEGTAE